MKPALLILTLLLFPSCKPVTNIEPPKIRLEFRELCGDQGKSIDIDKLLIYKINKFNGNKQKYQGHFGNVPSGISFLGLPGKYLIETTFQGITKTKTINWPNTQSLAIKFEFDCGSK